MKYIAVNKRGGCDMTLYFIKVGADGEEGPPCTYWIPTISGKLMFSTTKAHALIFISTKRK